MCSANAIYCLGLSLILIGTVLLTSLTSELYPSYSYSREFDQVKCTVDYSDFIGNVCCEASVKNINKCDKDYVYPCLKVNVSIGGRSVEDVLLYDDYESATYGGRIDDCSYFHCDSRSYDDHMQSVKEFKKKHKSGDKFDCYYSRQKKRVALATIVTSGAVTHSLVWSILLTSAGIITCVVMFVIGWQRKQSKDFDNINPLDQSGASCDNDEDSDIETIHVDNKKEEKTVPSEMVVSSPARRTVNPKASPAKA